MAVESSRFSSEQTSRDDKRDGSRYLSQVFYVCFFIALAYSSLSLTLDATVGVAGVGIGVADDEELELDDDDDDDGAFLVGLLTAVGYLLSSFFLALVLLSSSESYSASLSSFDLVTSSS